MSTKNVSVRRSFLSVLSHLSLFLVLLPYLALAVYLLIRGIGQASPALFDSVFWSHGLYTVTLCVGSVLIACLIGFPAAVYLEEFAGNSPWFQVLRYSLSLLSRLPAVFVGMFVVTMFRPQVLLGHSFSSSLLALSIVILPAIIQGCRHALQSIPNHYRNAILSLGATGSDAFRYLIFPYIVPRFGWYALIALGRAIGETTAVFIAAGGFQATQSIAVDVLESTLHSQYAFTYALILLVFSFLTGILGEFAANAGEKL